MSESSTYQCPVPLPYLPEGGEVQYVPADHSHMTAAQEAAEELSLDPDHPTGAVLVRDGKILGRGANGSEYHQKYGCERKKLGIETGKGYELCPGCDPIHHAERRALRDALDHKRETRGADLYLWGHWWCCQWCWEAMIEAGVENVYLVEGAYEKFGGNR